MSIAPRNWKSGQNVIALESACIQTFYGFQTFITKGKIYRLSADVRADDEYGDLECELVGDDGEKALVRVSLLRDLSKEEMQSEFRVILHHDDGSEVVSSFPFKFFNDAMNFYKEHYLQGHRVTLTNH